MHFNAAVETQTVISAVLVIEKILLATLPKNVCGIQRHKVLARSNGASV
jgi:hypothetical protein